MGEPDRGGAVSYNYSRFDDYVAVGGDAADEAAFWQAPRAGQRAPDFTLPRFGDGAHRKRTGSGAAAGCWRPRTAS